MKKRLLTFLIDAVVTVLLVLAIVVTIGLLNGAALHYGDDPRALDWDREGPYVFFEDSGSIVVELVRGSMTDGYSVERSTYPAGSAPTGTVFNPMDGTSFDFTIDPTITPPDTVYDDADKIFAVSDIEGNYRAFRDLLLVNGVVDDQLGWSFGAGHLVLLGDFVDRGFFSTQALWLIYKLEQEAREQGGRVHYILGNHEIKNLQGNFESASPKYFHVASILGRQQYELYGPSSLLGRWMASKNTAELIDGHLFVHGGIHPELAEFELGLDQLNRIVRNRYRDAYYPEPGHDLEELLVSTDTGPSWYRGYFKEPLTQDDVDRGLRIFDADKVVVGHTIQSRVNSTFEGRVIGIDVEHPADDHENWPRGRSEALLIDGGKYFRVLDSGEKIEL